MKYLGAHINGGFSRAFKLSEKLNINSVQVMPTAPMRWSLKEIPMEKAAQLSEISKAAQFKDIPLKKILIHGVYLINLARKDKQKFHLSKMSLVTYINFVEKVIANIEEAGLDIEILGVCFHPGSAIDLDPEEGIKRIGQGLNWIFNEAQSTEKSNLLLETTAGAGNVMGDKLEELAKMRDQVNAKFQERIGFVLDTQHMWASGYDWQNDLEGVMSKVGDTLGWENVASVHLNDSKPELGSNKDRHADLGEGNIGEEATKNIINHPQIVKNEIPVIMEVPSLKEEDGISAQMKRLRGLAE